MPPIIDSLLVSEIVRPTTTGTTEPYLCRLDDDELYAVKGRGALPRGLLAEAYAALLGRSLRLPIPEFVFGSVPAALLNQHADHAVRASIGAGPVFASLWQEPVEDVTMPFLRQLDERLLARLYVFDHWIRNGDRSLTEHGGNSNLLVRLTDSSLVVIDHNLAFSASHSTADMKLHACRGAWQSVRGNIFFKDQMESQMHWAWASIDGVEGVIPAEWLEDEPHFPQEVAATLARMDNRSFWDELG